MNTELQFSYEDCFEYLVADQVDLARVRALAESGQKLKIKLGIDPTSPGIHLGRAIAVWRLRAFQEMGHQIQLVVGDFTALVGDTSDKESERPMLSPEQVQANLADYEKQLWLILNPAKKDLVSFSYNSTWLSPISFSQFCQLADQFSVNQFIKREIIADRLAAGQRVGLREMFYPIMQGYDSVQLKSDLELGGSDQWFNLLAGRALQEQAGQTPQAILVHPIITGTDGAKMSSSLGNVISLNQEPFGLFTQMMQIPDQNMRPYLSFFPRPGKPFTEEELDQRLADGENPRDLKLAMAQQMTALLFGVEAAGLSVERWQQEASNHQQPSEIPIYQAAMAMNVSQVLMEAGLCSSKSDFQRLLEQGGISLNGQVISADQLLHPENDKGLIIRVGKHRFLQFGQ